MHHMEKQVRKWSLIVKNDELRFGGGKIARVVEVIAKHAADFHRVPVGPIGKKLSLNVCKYALAPKPVIFVSDKRWICHEIRQVKAQPPFLPQRIIIKD